MHDILDWPKSVNAKAQLSPQTKLNCSHEQPRFEADDVPLSRRGHAASQEDQMLPSLRPAPENRHLSILPADETSSALPDSAS